MKEERGAGREEGRGSGRGKERGNGEGRGKWEAEGKKGGGGKLAVYAEGGHQIFEKVIFFQLEIGF